MQPNTIAPLARENEYPPILTAFQQGQLLHIHFEGDFKYTTNAGKPWPTRQFQLMLCALLDSGYIVLRGGPKITREGRAWLDANHMQAKPLA